MWFKKKKVEVIKNSRFSSLWEHEFKINKKDMEKLISLYEMAIVDRDDENRGLRVLYSKEVGKIKKSSCFRQLERTCKIHVKELQDKIELLENRVEGLKQYRDENNPC